MKILGKEGLPDLDFNISKGKVTARQVAMLNKVEEEIPSASDVDKAGDIIFILCGPIGTKFVQGLTIKALAQNVEKYLKLMTS